MLGGIKFFENPCIPENRALVFDRKGECIAIIDFTKGIISTQVELEKIDMIAVTPTYMETLKQQLKEIEG